MKYCSRPAIQAGAGALGHSQVRVHGGAERCGANFQEHQEPRQTWRAAISNTGKTESCTCETATAYARAGIVRDTQLVALGSHGGGHVQQHRMTADYYGENATSRRPPGTHTCSAGQKDADCLTACPCAVTGASRGASYPILVRRHATLSGLPPTSQPSQCAGSTCGPAHWHPPSSDSHRADATSGTIVHHAQVAGWVPAHHGEGGGAPPTPRGSQ